MVADLTKTPYFEINENPVNFSQTLSHFNTHCLNTGNRSIKSIPISINCGPCPQNTKQIFGLLLENLP